MGIGYLRTLGRLERVSVIFRRLDSDFADHLELRAHSALGVPGLVDVIRAGNVGKANALGGGVVESPALDAHLPAECVARCSARTYRFSISRRHGAEPRGVARRSYPALGRGIVRNAFDAQAAVFTRLVGEIG
jgi:hypothetical protein